MNNDPNYWLDLLESFERMAMPHIKWKCEHKWADTGFRKTWCTREGCNFEGEWVSGHVTNIRESVCEPEGTQDTGKQLTGIGLSVRGGS